MGSGFEDLPSIAGGSTRFSTLVAASGRVRKDWLPFAPFSSQAAWFPRIFSAADKGYYVA